MIVGIEAYQVIKEDEYNTMTLIPPDIILKYDQCHLNIYMGLQPNSKESK